MWGVVKKGGKGIKIDVAIVIMFGAGFCPLRCEADPECVHMKPQCGRI